MTSHEDSIEKQVDEIFKTIDQYLAQKPIRKNIESDVNKELKKIKNLINITKEAISQSLKKSVTNREKKVKQTLEKIKPIVYITPEQRAVYREELVSVIKQIEKKLTAFNEKKDTKKRPANIDANIQFFKEHQAKLTMFVEWLSAPSRKFPSESMKKLKNYIQDLTISHDDTIFQEELKQIYDKIIVAANEPAEVSHNQFLASFQNRPKINDYLLTKQTKETLPRNSFVPQYKMIDLSVIPKMQKETLFFMFFYHKGEPEQYMAAKELMKSSWRFYTKNNGWIRRSSAPTFDANDYETGRYVTINSELQIREQEKKKVYYNSLIRKL